MILAILSNLTRVYMSIHQKTLHVQSDVMKQCATRNRKVLQPFVACWSTSSLLIAFFVAAALIDQSNATPPAQPWGGAALSDWVNASKAVVITNLSRCQPSSAFSDMVLRQNRWKVIPYRLNNGYEGEMIWAPPEANAPEVALAPDLDGWYAVFVGLFATVEAPSTVWIRLNDHAAPVPRFNKRTDNGNTEEVYFQAVRLRKDSRVLFSPQTTGEVSGCGITHVKLIPLADDEVVRLEADASDRTHRVLAATNDGFSDMFHRSPKTESSLLSAVEIFKGTDFGTLILQAGGGDKVNYQSKAGFMWGSETEAFPRLGDRYFAESARALAKQDINPVKSLTKRAHEIGMQVHVSLRPAGWSFFEPYSDFWESAFYKDHPEWRCEDRDGTPVTRMSWAVPDVRRHLIALQREMVRFGADGVNIVFTRGYPLVLYERTARELFQREYGIDPREIPETDPRINKFRTDVVTKFFEELRAMLDEEQKLRGGKSKRLALSVIINGSAANDLDDLVFGVDLRRLVSAKLVDEVFTEHGFGSTEKDFNLNFLREVCEPGGIPFSPGIYHAGTRYASVLPRYFDSRPHGLTVWDAEIDDVYEWCWMSRFGHMEETQWRLKNLNLKKPPRSINTFHKLGDQVRNGRFGPNWGG